MPRVSVGSIDVVGLVASSEDERVEETVVERRGIGAAFNCGAIPVAEIVAQID
jgi:hypothetical protein